MQYCFVQHQTLLPSPVTSTTGYCFALAQSLHTFWSYSPPISSSILGTYQPGQFIFQCPIFLPFHTVHGVIKARILKWLATPFSSGARIVRSLHHDLHLALHSMAHSFLELDKAVVHVIRLVMKNTGAVLVVQWFRICLAMQGIWVQSLVGEFRSTMPQSN